MTVPSSASSDRRLQLLNAYEAKTDLLLSALALVYLTTYSGQSIIYRPGENWYAWLTLFGYFLWLLFVADLAFRIVLSSDRCERSTAMESCRRSAGPLLARRS